MRETGEEGGVHASSSVFVLWLYLYNVALCPAMFAWTRSSFCFCVFAPPPLNLVLEFQEDATSRVTKEGKDQSKQKERPPLMALMGLSAASRIMLALLIIPPYLSPTVAQFKVQPCAESQCSS